MTRSVITFADKFYRASAEKLQASCERFGLLTDIYTPDHFDADFKTRAEEILRYKRGHGLFVWKPWVICQQLAKASEGDLFIYSDAGAVMVADPSPLFDIAMDEKIVLFEVYGCPEYSWTKPEVLNLYPGLDTSTWQRMGTFSVWKNCGFAKDFSREWMNLCLEKKYISPETKARSKLIEHRHDQSLLSTLSKAKGLRAHRDPTQFGEQSKASYPRSIYGQIFESTRQSNLGVFRRIDRSVMPKVHFLLRKLKIR